MNSSERETNTAKLGTHVEEVLTAHFLYLINCDHKTHRDRSSCGCGWASEWEPSVGHAVRAWARHAIGLMNLTAAAPAEADKK